jgi:NitT/TauT family transport system substrate-binding protein
VLGLLVSLSGCSTKPSSVAGKGGGGGANQIRLGYFANLTHATPLVGLARGFYARELGPTTVSTQVFQAGPAAVEAIFAGAVDAAYVGPNPAINAYTKSEGEAVRVVAGATSGGAALVVKPEIKDAAGLKGKRIATPQRGNTQDVALRAWLAGKGLKTDISGGGDVKVTPTENPTTLQAFQKGDIDGAWVPEPWASRLVVEAGAKLLVDERSLWPQGRFVTTHLLVATRFLNEHPDRVAALLRAHVAANQWITSNKDEAKSLVNGELAKLSGKPLKGPVLDRAWANITVINDPVASSLATSAQHAQQAGLLKPANLKGIYDLRPLNQVLQAAGQPPVTDAQLGPG